MGEFGMTTKLTKSVRRETKRGLFDSENGRKLIVMLEAGDIVAIKTKRSHSWKRIAINTLFLQLCQRDVKQMRKEKRRR